MHKQFIKSIALLQGYFMDINLNIYNIYIYTHTCNSL